MNSDWLKKQCSFPETRIWKSATWVQGCLWRYANCLDQPISIKFDHVLELFIFTSWLCSIASCFENSSVAFTVYQFIKPHLYMVSKVNGSANKTVFVFFRRHAARYVQRRPGGTPRKSGWGCAALLPKPLPNLWPKSAIFPTLIMTWPLDQNPVSELRYN